MNKVLKTMLIGLFFLSVPYVGMAKQWTLQDCITYALQNNITLRKNVLTKLSAHEDVLQSKAALLPSLSANTSQNVNYTPWQASGTATVTNGYVQSSIDKVSYNGSYAVGANWTVWNGGQNTNTVKLNKIAEQQAELDSAVTANSIQEQIVQYYVQILYSAEAIKVNQSSLETSKTNENRGMEMYKVGKMSKADLAQLTAKRAQDEYNVVNAQSNLANYKRQLKQLLQITNDEEFDIAIPKTTDEMAYQEIPGMTTVYNAAMNWRPEIKNAQLAISGSDLGIKIAKAQGLPTIGLSASVGTNTTTLSSNSWGNQMKTNFNLGGGITVSFPIFDQRAKKTAVNKAYIQKQNYQLDLQDKATTLYSTIENYWLQANTQQNQFKAAKVSTESAQASYDLLSEQFRLGLKNIVELLTGKDNLLSAQQAELQSKYMTIYNINMLKFYEDGQLK